MWHGEGHGRAAADTDGTGRNHSQQYDCAIPIRHDESTRIFHTPTSPCMAFASSACTNNIDRFERASERTKWVLEFPATFTPLFLECGNVAERVGYGVHTITPDVLETTSKYNE